MLRKPERHGDGGGTRFRLFPQSPFDRDGLAPETIEVSAPAGSIGPGPADARMYLVSPIGKQFHYGLNAGPYGTPWLYLAPWRGPIDPPVRPGPAGHFDHLAPGTEEFEAAHLFGSVSAVLDIWEGYFGAPIFWHFERDAGRLELCLLPWWENAQLGYGYLEVGSDWSTGAREPFSLLFEVVAHEVGHGIIYSQIGLPDLGHDSGEYFAFHESAADWVAMIASVNFDTVVDELLTTTSGNLYTYNHFNRFAVTSRTRQIRLASNSLKMSDFAAGWDDEHLLSQVLTGCIFDIFVDLFHDLLHDSGRVARGADELFDIADRTPQHIDKVQGEFDRLFALSPEVFYEAFGAARDATAELLVATWRRLSPDDLTFAGVGEAMLAADRQITGGRLQHAIRSNLRWREIGLIAAGPMLAPPGPKSHSHSSRTHVPEDRHILPRMSYHERYLVACQHCRRGQTTNRSRRALFG